MNEIDPSVLLMGHVRYNCWSQHTNALYCVGRNFHVEGHNTWGVPLGCLFKRWHDPKFPTLLPFDDQPVNLSLFIAEVTVFCGLTPWCIHTSLMPIVIYLTIAIPVTSKHKSKHYVRSKYRNIHMLSFSTAALGYAVPVACAWRRNFFIHTQPLHNFPRSFNICSGMNFVLLQDVVNVASRASCTLI